MKEPIEPSEIRKGDLIRFEYDGDPREVAEEWRAQDDADGFHFRAPGHHYLIDRPKPDVELPTEPTLGWLTANDERPYLSHVKLDGERAMTDGLYYAHASRVTAFTPATAVPTAALDELRGVARAHLSGYLDFRVLTTFLAAVDEAQS